MKPREILLIVLGVLLLIVVFQNTEVVALRFLFWKFSMSRVLLVLFTALLGVGAGYLLGRSKPRR